MPTSPPTRTNSGPNTTVLSLERLRETAVWIRNDLDPLVSRNGLSSLDPDVCLTLHTLMLTLQSHHVPVFILRHSRIYLAVREMCGKATRWPRKLVDEADLVIERWEQTIGPLRNIRTPLYEQGGRLFGICEPKDTSRELLLERFLARKGIQKDDSRAYQHGSRGLKPGKWWLNSTFVFREGVIDEKCLDGGIVHNKTGAYALVLRGEREWDSPHPSVFKYHCDSTDRGRFRLTSAHARSRYPIRVFRDHRSKSLWAPRAGIRYDGLYTVIGWNISMKGDEFRYDIQFQNFDPSINWDRLSYIPSAEDMDDHKVYKIIQHEQRALQSRKANQYLSRIPTSALDIADISDPSVASSPLSSGNSEMLIRRDRRQSIMLHLSSPEVMDREKGAQGHASRPATLVDGSWDPSGAASAAPVRSQTTRNIAILAGIQPRHRRTYDGSDDPVSFVEDPVHSATIDTRFRPVNWTPGPRLNLSPAFDIPEDKLNEIAPFTDLRRASSFLADVPISPKTRARGLYDRRRPQSSISEVILEGLEVA